jgi:hypothetical protein
MPLKKSCYSSSKWETGMLFFHALCMNSSFKYVLKFKFLVAVVLNQLWPDLGRLVVAAMVASSTMISKDPT